MASFKEQIGKFNAKTEKAADMIVRGTSLSLFARLVELSPVGNPSLWENKALWRLQFGVKTEEYSGGRFRGDWQISINRPASGNTGSKTPDKSKANMLKAGDTAFITNNMPYSISLERGHSKQAPSGMVAVTAAEFKAHVKRSARKNKV